MLSAEVFTGCVGSIGEMPPLVSLASYPQRAAVQDIEIPKTGDRIELICDLCAHRIVKADYKETTKFDEALESKYTPSCSTLIRSFLL
ncbi:MAG TPA: hypothetical protein VFJ51_06445 [Nitrososphaeraceae archaeon]|nr:hypothetical protein [Nitrososphaeraceae archaeon]